jgi:hypothetical protein
MAEYPDSENEKRIAPPELRRAIGAIFAVCGMSDADAALLAASHFTSGHVSFSRAA